METYNQFVQEKDIPGLTEMKEFNVLMSNFLRENTRETGLTIFVTHDMLIAFLHYSINKTIYNKGNWVKYLSGLLLKNGKYEK